MSIHENTPTKLVECESIIKRKLCHMGYNSSSSISYKPLCDDCIIRQVNRDEEKMRSKEEVEKMFEATKKELDKVLEADTPRTGDSMQEAKRLMLNAQLGILTWVLGIEK